MAWWRRRRYQDFTAEVASHIELETDRLIEEGISPEDARSAAIRKFGNPTSAREVFYEARRVLLLDGLRRDFRHAVRRLARSPVFTLTAILTLALGIGMTASVFDVAEPLLTRSLPVANPGELFLFRTRDPALGSPDRVPDELYQRLVVESRTLSGVLAFLPSPLGSSLDLVVEGESADPQGDGVQADYVTGSYFAVLGVNAGVGRLLGESDQVVDAPTSAVISHRLWQTRFGGSPDAVGKGIRLRLPIGGIVDGVTIVGVAAPGFDGPDIDADPDIWLPFQSRRGLGGLGGTRVMGRGRDGVGIEEIQAEVYVLLGELTDATWAVDRMDRPSVRVEPGRNGYSELRFQFSAAQTRWRLSGKSRCIGPGASPHPETLPVGDPQHLPALVAEVDVPPPEAPAQLAEPDLAERLGAVRADGCDVLSFPESNHSGLPDSRRPGPIG